MFKSCPILPLYIPLYLVATGLRTIQLLSFNGDTFKIVVVIWMFQFWDGCSGSGIYKITWVNALSRQPLLPSISICAFWMVSFVSDIDITFAIAQVHLNCLTSVLHSPVTNAETSIQNSSVLDLLLLMIISIFCRAISSILRHPPLCLHLVGGLLYVHCRQSLRHLYQPDSSIYDKLLIKLRDIWQKWVFLKCTNVT
jgi:hypothetical protein